MSSNGLQCLLVMQYLMMNVGANCIRPGRAWSRAISIGRMQFDPTEVINDGITTKNNQNIYIIINQFTKGVFYESIDSIRVTLLWKQ